MPVGDAKAVVEATAMEMPPKPVRIEDHAAPALRAGDLDGVVPGGGFKDADRNPQAVLVAGHIRAAPVGGRRRSAGSPPL